MPDSKEFDTGWDVFAVCWDQEDLGSHRADAVCLFDADCCLALVLTSYVFRTRHLCCAYFRVAKFEDLTGSGKPWKARMELMTLYVFMCQV